jgi:hypothetical protein
MMSESDISAIVATCSGGEVPRFRVFGNISIRVGVLAGLRTPALLSSRDNGVIPVSKKFS